MFLYGWLGVSVLFNRQSDSLLLIHDHMVNGEADSDLVETVKEGTTDKYIPLPNQFEMDDYKMMADFIDQLPSGKTQESLTRAIRGRGAFRRFKDTVCLLEIEEEWYNFQEECYSKIARDWYHRYGIRVIEE